jgi:hypothetical protein
MIQGVANVAALRLFTGVDAQLVWLEGTTTYNDGGQSMYVYNASSTASDNGTSVIAPSGSTIGRWLQTTPFVAPGTFGFVESTVNTNQSPTLNSTGTFYVATGNINVNLPATSGLNTRYNLGVMAEGGTVTLIPSGSDQINAGGAGVSFVLYTGTSVFLSTDAAGNWYTFFKGTRQVLSAALNLYVSPSGSDANTGLSALTPFQTLQKAWTVLSEEYDLNGFQATINLAHGTYTGGVICSGQVVGQQGNAVIFSGDVASPASVVVNTSAADCFLVRLGAYVGVQGMTLTTNASNCNCFNVFQAIGYIGQNMIFGAANLYHIVAQQQSVVSIYYNYTITGGANCHIAASLSSLIAYLQNTVTVTVTGTPAFSGQFALGSLAGVIWAIGVTYSGSATGTRYIAQLNGVIMTNGGGANYFPGNGAGSTATGGQYS